MMRRAVCPGSFDPVTNGLSPVVVAGLVASVFGVAVCVAAVISPLFTTPAPPPKPPAPGRHRRRAIAEALSIFQDDVT